AGRRAGAGDAGRAPRRPSRRGVGAVSERRAGRSRAGDVSVTFFDASTYAGSPADSVRRSAR
ncbi:hypothetical protein E4L65_16005, partial [Burkholderia pseudomallei]|nr:hypothetical protein [Burkholderia pseudomallei]